MDNSSQWTQELGVAKTILMGGEVGRGSTERKVRAQKEEALNCPRCHSTNTKFCYYNNYSLTQPRYFCKTCRRYWTEGGTLRNVPVGGGSRKNKRYAPTPQKHIPDLNPKVHDQGGHDLNLAFQDYHHHHNHQYVEFPKIESRDVVMHASSSALALDFLRSGIGGGGGGGFNSSFMAQTDANIFAFKAAPSLDDVSPQQNMTGSLMFALGAGSSKPNTTSHELGDQNKGQQNSNGFWNGAGAWS